MEDFLVSATGPTLERAPAGMSLSWTVIRPNGLRLPAATRWHPPCRVALPAAAFLVCFVALWGGMGAGTCASAAAPRSTAERPLRAGGSAASQVSCPWWYGLAATGA